MTSGPNFLHAHEMTIVRRLLYEEYSYIIFGEKTGTSNMEKRVLDKLKFYILYILIITSNLQ